MTPSPGAWLDRPAGRLVAAVLILLILTAPVWLMADRFNNFALLGDDFLYLAGARDLPTLLSNLLRPHNTHVVPLFRVWTYLLYGISGRLAALPPVLGVASYAALAAAMIAAGLLVTRETRSPALGLAAMSGLGATSVLEPTVAWYSAGQAIGAGAAILATLLAALGWRERGGTGRLALVLIGMIAAPAIWSGGLAAGPATAAFLYADGRSRCRRAAMILLAATVAVTLLVVGLSRRQIAETRIIWEAHDEVLPRPVQAALHTAQAIPEGLVLNNLGLDAETSDAQGIVITLILAAAWAWSRRDRPRPNPLEAAGAVMVLFSFLMVFFFRGNLPYSSVRGLFWYFAIPHIGAVLFGAGWWSGGSINQPRPRPLTRGGALVVIAVLAALLTLHAARLKRKMVEDAPALSPTERYWFATPDLQYRRGRYLLSIHADRQRFFLTRLDQVHRIAAQRGIGRDAILRVFGRFVGPGMPEHAEGYNALDLLTLPQSGRESDPTVLRQVLGPYLTPVPEKRPPWLASDEPWPPPPRPTISIPSGLPSTRVPPR